LDIRLLLRDALPVLGLGVIVAGILQGTGFAVALLVGGICGMAHLLALGRNVVAFLGQGEEARPVQLAVGYLVRLLVAAVILLGLLQFFDPIPLVIGFGLALLAATLRVARGDLLVADTSEGA